MNVFALKEIKDKNGNETGTTWTKSGSAYVNKDGSMNIYLDVLPVSGKLHVRDQQPERREGNEVRANENRANDNRANENRANANAALDNFAMAEAH